MNRVDAAGYSRYGVFSWCAVYSLAPQERGSAMWSASYHATEETSRFILSTSSIECQLLVAQGINRIETCSSARREESEDDADSGGEEQRE